MWCTIFRDGFLHTNAQMKKSTNLWYCLKAKSRCFQIRSSKVEQIMDILRRVKSSYYAAFKDVCLKVDEGRQPLLVIRQCLFVDFVIMSRVSNRNRNRTHKFFFMFLQKPKFTAFIMSFSQFLHSLILQRPRFFFPYLAFIWFFCVIMLI